MTEAVTLPAPVAAPVTAAAIEAARWERETYVRGPGFESWAYACRDFPELTLTHTVRRGGIAQTLHVGGRVIALFPTDRAFPRAAELINQLRAAGGPQLQGDQARRP